MKILTTFLSILCPFLSIFSSSVKAEYPEKPIEIVVPFSKGGGTDLLMRALAPQLSKSLKTAINVKNVSGKGGTVGASKVAQAQSDGYNLGYLPIAVVTIQPHIKEVTYGLDSWTPICLVATSPVMFYVESDSNFKSIEDVKKAVLKKPKAYSYGSSGIGSMPHLAMASALSNLNLQDKVAHTVLQGSGPVLKSMSAGEIHFLADIPALLKSGRLKPLAVFNEQRLVSFPDVPTMAESGIKPPFDKLNIWGGLFAPKGLDPKIVERITKSCKEGVKSKGFQAFTKYTNAIPKYLNPEEFNNFYKDQYKNNEILVNTAGIHK